MFQDHMPRAIWRHGSFCLSLILVMLGCSPEKPLKGAPSTGTSPAVTLPSPVLPQRASRDKDLLGELQNKDPLSSSPRSLVPLAAGIRKVSSGEVALTFLLFDDRQYNMVVADKDQGLATEWQTAEAAAAGHGAVAAINGGFFTPEGKPLGLVIEDGRRIGTWNSQSSLTSGVLSVEKAPRLLRRQHWRSFSPTRHLLQAGPFLIENNAVVRDLSNRERRPRSFLVWNGRHRWAFGVAEGATLAGLSAALASQPLPEINITTALNLDGGRSSDMWVSPRITGGPISTRRIWNTPVRNYLLLLPSQP
ncbi:MAG: hypothetical protein CMN06_13070 [Roseibacillus sp.]|nr:hypothetical protein [Roseibacillus sp.]|tara:strand:- start:5009 stop:5926 length:918 start_codon:yes stop_codon:yes gene_type:complete